MHEYQEQKAIEQIALARYPQATGVKDIKPVLTGNQQTDFWMVTLTTADQFVFILTSVTTEDVQTFLTQKQ